MPVSPPSDFQHRQEVLSNIVQNSMSGWKERFQGLVGGLVVGAIVVTVLLLIRRQSSNGSASDLPILRAPYGSADYQRAMGVFNQGAPPDIQEQVKQLNKTDGEAVASAVLTCMQAGVRLKALNDAKGNLQDKASAATHPDVVKECAACAHAITKIPPRITASMIKSQKTDACQLPGATQTLPVIGLAIEEMLDYAAQVNAVLPTC